MCYEWPSIILLEVGAVSLTAHNLVAWLEDNLLY